MFTFDDYKKKQDKVLRECIRIARWQRGRTGQPKRILFYNDCLRSEIRRHRECLKTARGMFDAEAHILPRWKFGFFDIPKETEIYQWLDENPEIGMKQINHLDLIEFDCEESLLAFAIRFQ